MSDPPLAPVPVDPEFPGVEGCRLEAVELRRVRFRLADPFVASHGTIVERRPTLVRAVLEGGSEGWGECAALERPGYTAEYADGAFDVLARFLVPAALAGEPPGVVGHPMAAAALEAAVVDASLRAVGKSLAVALGGSRTAVASTATVGRCADVDVLVDRVGARLEAGHRGVVVKIAPGWDREPLAAVRSTWPDLPVGADANGAYVPGQPEALAALDDLGLVHLEQPFPADALAETAELARRLATPIALDESVSSAAQLRAACRIGAIGVLNLKPARVGGFRSALEVLEVAHHEGVPSFVGGMLETGIGRAAALCMAAHPACEPPTQLGPSAAYSHRDLTRPFELGDGGVLAVPSGPGIGVRPDPATLEATTLGEPVVLRP